MGSYNCISEDPSAFLLILKPAFFVCLLVVSAHVDLQQAYYISPVCDSMCSGTKYTACTSPMTSKGAADNLQRQQTQPQLSSDSTHNLDASGAISCTSIRLEYNAYNARQHNVFQRSYNNQTVCKACFCHARNLSSENVPFQRYSCFQPPAADCADKQQSMPSLKCLRRRAGLVWARCQ